MTTDPIWLMTCVGVNHDLPLLPHWLRHYLDLGVDPGRIVMILNADDAEAPALTEARSILEAHGVTHPPEMWIAPYTSGTMWKKRGEVQQRVCDLSDWVLNADVDEFHRWPEPLAQCLARAASLGADCVQGVMIDRLAPGGALAAVQSTPNVLEQFPIRAEVAWSIGGSSPVHGRGGTVKMMAARGHLLPHRGGHRPAIGSNVNYLYRHPLGSFWEIDDPAFRFSVPTQVEHVHWTDTLPQRLTKRLATPGVSPAGAEYGQRQLNHFARNGGGIALSEVALEEELTPCSSPWSERLRELRQKGRRKPLTTPVYRIVNRFAGRRTMWIVNAGRRAVGLQP